MAVFIIATGLLKNIKTTLEFVDLTSQEDL